MFILEVVEALTKSRVSFAIAGGYAVALHGAVRGTVDIDLVLALNEANYLNCESALLSLGLEPRLPVGAKEVFQFREEYIQKKNLTAWSYYDPKDPTRLVDIIITYGKKTIPTKVVKLKSKSAPILEKQALIKMKKDAGRPQDLEDIKALESLT